jgi:uncharacterized repeat protein (TIGR03803 family)
MTVASHGKTLRSQAAQLAIMCGFALIVACPGWAQTFSVIHGFTGGPDGANPVATLTVDAANHLYGTAAAGGNAGGQDCGPIGGCGLVFRMSRSNSGWILLPLHQFAAGADAAGPEGAVVFGPDGSLYGSGNGGGNGTCSDNYFPGCGSVYKVRPQASLCHSVLCYWTETTLYGFAQLSDGSLPQGDVAFDSTGNLYGTTYSGGLPSTYPCGNGFRGCGIVYQLSPVGSGWQKTAIHSFTGGLDGGAPASGVLIDAAGNVYGTTEFGGTHDGGVVYQLTPSGSGWFETVLHNFNGPTDGGGPLAGLVTDAAGNLYGATQGGGPGGGGTVFQLTHSGGGWTFNVIYSFNGGQGPYSTLAFDHAGNLFGATNGGGTFQCGNVFKLANSGGSWSYSNLHDFTCGNDGGNPYGGVSLDSSGNLYGTTLYYGPSGNLYCGADIGPIGCGVVWKIEP